MTIINTSINIDTQGLTKNQIITKIYEIVFECKIIKKNSHGYVVQYNDSKETEYLRYKEIKDKLKSKQGSYFCI